MPPALEFPVTSFDGGWDLGDGRRLSPADAIKKFFLFRVISVFALWGPSPGSS